MFVFGSNLAGIHGAGSARAAWQDYGAEWGVGEGRTGRAYAIPTKDKQLQPRDLVDIEASVKSFIAYATARSDLKFMVTKVGCGLAGYRDADIKPFFVDAPENCVLPPGWGPEVSK